jgi:hypothetical protein
MTMKLNADAATDSVMNGPKTARLTARKSDLNLTTQPDVLSEEGRDTPVKPTRKRSGAVRITTSFYRKGT